MLIFTNHCNSNNLYCKYEIIEHKTMNFSPFNFFFLLLNNRKTFSTEKEGLYAHKNKNKMFVPHFSSNLCDENFFLDCYKCNHFVIQKKNKNSKKFYFLFYSRQGRINLEKKKDLSFTIQKVRFIFLI